MTISNARGTNRAAELREAFDRSFAQAPRTEAAAVENLLAINVGADPYVLRMDEVSGLFTDKKVTRFPGPVSELSGIGGFRGAVLPVYDLALLLGYSGAASPRWLVVLAAAPVALAFDSFDGYLSVRDAAIVPEARAEERDRHVKEVVQIADRVRPLISLTSILTWIRIRASSDDVAKER